LAEKLAACGLKLGTWSRFPAGGGSAFGGKLVACNLQPET